VTAVGRLLPVLVVVGFVAVALLTGGLVAAAGAGSDDRDDPRPGAVLGPGTVTVTLDIEHSRFLPDRLSVRPGTEVRFVVDNGDPINHELILGDERVHRIHELGNHAAHPPVPGEVSVGAGATGETTFSFGSPGDVEFACHLPGHYAFGMRGVVRVVEAPQSS
jgi:uncharacterized cupredoxin-like copper-binding protein